MVETYFIQVELVSNIETRELATQHVGFVCPRRVTIYPWGLPISKGRNGGRLCWGSTTECEDEMPMVSHRDEC